MDSLGNTPSAGLIACFAEKASRGVMVAKTMAQKITSNWLREFFPSFSFSLFALYIYNYLYLRFWGGSSILRSKVIQELDSCVYTRKRETRFLACIPSCSCLNSQSTLISSTCSTLLPTNLCISMIRLSQWPLNLWEKSNDCADAMVMALLDNLQDVFVLYYFHSIRHLMWMKSNWHLSTL